MSLSIREFNIKSGQYSSRQEPAKLHDGLGTLLCQGVVLLNLGAIEVRSDHPRAQRIELGMAELGELLVRRVWRSAMVSPSAWEADERRNERRVCDVPQVAVDLNQSMSVHESRPN